MANIQKQFEQFNENIKLRRYSENALLVEKRDRVLKTLREGLERQRTEGEKIPAFRTFNQGSYEVGVGVKPIDGDYDIDVGVAFALSKDEFGPLAVKTWVFDAVSKHTQRVEMRGPCVTVFYQSEGEPVYHVDLAVYADKEPNGGKLYLARGKQTSADGKEWNLSDPEGLTEAINARFTGEDGQQFRRIIRALKRWKDNKFAKAGHAAPRGIALTIAAYKWFIPRSLLIDGQWQRDDLDALRNVVSAMLVDFRPRLALNSPAEPFDDTCRRMSDVQMGEFKAKLEALRDALQTAAADVDPHTACKVLAELFGDDFPVPAPEKTAKPQQRAVTSSGSSG